MDRPAVLTNELGPLRSALAGEARREADARLAEARRRAESIVGEAHTRAREITASAISEGESVARRQSARRLVEARRQARRQVLAAQRRAYERLIEASVRALTDSRDEDALRELRARLTHLAEAALGGEAVVEPDPEGPGGILARAGGRRVDLRTRELVRRCVSRMGEEVTRLWT